MLLWWIYFDTGALRGTRRIEHAQNPGREGRSAYTYAHILIVAGIIVSAVADGATLKAAAAKDRLRDRYVRQVAGAHPDVVRDEDVSGRQRLRRKRIEKMPDRARHGADEGRYAVGRLGE